MLRAVILLLMFCLSSQSYGGMVEDLYDARVSVERQTTNTQDRAARDALIKVLVKVSGSRDVLQHPFVKSKLRQAEDFIRLYRFVSEEDSLYYQASFDAQKVDQLIRTAGYPIWGKRRPETLIWLAVQTPESMQRTLLSEAADSPFKQTVSVAAKDRGIEVIYPLMDLQELEQISVYDVWGRFGDTLNQASQRYRVEAVMIARLYQQQDNQDNYVERVDDAEYQPLWQLDWSVLTDDDTRQGSLTGTDAEVLLQDLINLHADTQARQFAVNINNQSEYREPAQLSFMNVGDIHSYVQIKSLLESLTVVARAELTTIQGTRGTFTLQLLADEQSLVAALQLDDRVSRRKDQFGQPVSAYEFIWRP